MDVEKFCFMFRQKLESVLAQDLFLPSKGEANLAAGDWTACMNYCVVDLIHDYNQLESAHLQVCMEPEAGKTPRGRGGYSDMLIHDSDSDKPIICVEHENYPGTKGKLADIVKKLSKSHAMYKLLITYYFEILPKREILSQLSTLVREHFKAGDVLHLLIARQDTGCGDDYEHLAIPADSRA